MIIIKYFFFIFALIGLTSCFDRIGGIFILNASQLATTPIEIDQYFEDVKGNEYIYNNVAKDEDDNFLTYQYGYIKSTAGIPDNLMRFKSSSNIIVVGINIDIKQEVYEILEPSKVDEDGYSHYVLAGYSDFKISFSGFNYVSIGQIIFWC